MSEQNVNLQYVKPETQQELIGLCEFIKKYQWQICDSGKFSCLVFSFIFQDFLLIPRSIQASVLPSFKGENIYLCWRPTQPEILSVRFGGSGEEAMLYEETAKEIIAQLEDNLQSFKQVLTASA